MLQVLKRLIGVAWFAKHTVVQRRDLDVQPRRYGTSEFHPDRRRTVYGFSEKVLELIPQIEQKGIVPYIKEWYKEKPDT